jgi:hypothetical protein
MYSLLSREYRSIERETTGLPVGEEMKVSCAWYYLQVLCVISNKRLVYLLQYSS